MTTTDLRKAAQKNLAALASGQVRQQQLAKRTQRQVSQELAQMRRQAFQAALLEVRHLEEELEQLDHLMENIGEVACDGDEMGALEEVDHRRDQVVEELNRLRDHWQL